MRLNVAQRTALAVAVEHMGKSRRPAKRSARPARVTERKGIVRKDGKNRHEVGAFPFARFPCLVPSDRSAGGQTKEPAPILQIYFRFETRSLPAEQSRRSIGQVSEDRTALEPGIDQVENFLESGGHGPSQQSGSRREALSTAEQFLTSV